MTDLLFELGTLVLVRILQLDLLYLYAFEGLDSPSAPSGGLSTELLPRRPDETKNGVVNIGGLLCRLSILGYRVEETRVNGNVNEGSVLRSG
jgi:hypothetical protein